MSTNTIETIEKQINTRSYWNARFGSKDWENSQGKQQTLFFGQLAIDNMPSWLKVYIKSKNLSICDFGCALGQATKLLATTFPNSDVTGQDISELGVEEAKRLFPKLKFTSEDLLQATEEQYDVLFSSNTLEHFYDPHDIISKLANSTRKFLIFLLPFYDDLKIEEHFYSFTYKNIPRVIADKFSLLYYKETDVSRIPNTHWNGRQILLVYAVDSVMDELDKNEDNLILCQPSIKKYRLALTESVLKAEDERNTSNFLAFPIKQQLEQTLAQEQAEHQATKQQLEQTLAQEQAEHQATKQQLEQTLAQEQAEHQATKQQLEQTLAQEQAEHQATKQQLEQTLAQEQAEHQATKQQLEQTLAQEQAEHQATKQQLEQTLAQEQAEHQATKQQLEQAEAFRNYVLHSFSWKLTKPMRSCAPIRQAIRLVAYKGKLNVLKKSYSILRRESAAVLVARIKSKILPNNYREQPQKNMETTYSVADKEISSDFYSYIDRFINKNIKKKIFLFQASFYDVSGKNFYSGGAERYITDLIQIFQNEFNCDCLLVQMGDSFWQKKHGDFNIIAAPVKSDYSQYTAVINSLIHKSTINIFSPFSLRSNSNKGICIGISHGVFWDDVSQLYNGIHQNLVENLKNIDLLISVDTSTINFFRGYMGFQKLPKHLFIPNYVDTSFFFPQESQSAKKTINIMFPRRLCDARGFDLTASIVKEVLNQYDNVAFDFVGFAHDEYDSKIKKLIKDFPDKIRHYLLDCEEMATAYRKADIVLIPTLFAEGTSLSCLEAMACQKAVICTNVGGLTDLVLNDYNGLLIAPTKEALYDAIIDLIEDPDKRARLALNAATVAKSFSKLSWRDKWIKVIGEYLLELPHKISDTHYKHVIVYEHNFPWVVDYVQRPQHMAKSLGDLDNLVIYKDPTATLKKTVHKNVITTPDATEAYKENPQAIVYVTCFTPYISVEFLKNHIDHGRAIIYDYIDEISPDILQKEVPKELIESFNYAVENENIIVCASANKLYDHVSTLRGTQKNVLLVENAVYLQDFIKIETSHIQKNLLELRNPNRKVIGFYGSVASWFDFELVKKIALSRPRFQVIIIGVYDKALFKKHELHKIDNIYAIPPIQYKALIPTANQLFDLAIIPFLINDVTESTSPVKLFEYMALGKPIVTTDMPECRKYKSALIAKDHDEFISLIDKALKIPKDDEYFKVMKKEAEENTWDARAKVIIEAINENLNAR